MGRSVTPAPSGVKSIQTGDLNGVTTSTGSASENSYYDVTINSVDTAKSVIHHTSMFGTTATSPYTTYTYMALAKFVNNTTIRFYNGGSSHVGYLSSRWTVIEYY